MKEITNNIYYVGVNDRNKNLFEGLWPLPKGVSYNSYLIVDEKVCLVDTVEVDTLSEHVATEILDSLSAAPVEHPDEQHAKAVEHSNHKQAEDVSVETKSKEQHKAKEPHLSLIHI